jgi:hypothetical protein
MAAAAPPALGGDLLGDAIDSGLSELATEANLPEGTPEGEAAPETEESAITDASAEVAPAEAEAAPEGEAAPAAAAPSDGPYPLSQDGNGYVVPKQDFQILDGQRQYTEAVQNFFPTANDAQVAYNEATDFRSMLTDYVTGEPNLIDSVLAHWAGMGETDPTMQQQFQQSFVKMAERMPETLRQVNPQAYDQFMGGIINSKVEELYNIAAQSGDPADLFKAQELDHALTGQYKTELPKYDPDASLRQQIEQRQQTLEQRENQIMERDWKAFNGGWDPKTGAASGAISGPKWQSYFSEINRALEPFKANYAPQVFKALVNEVNSNLMAKLQSADPLWAQNHNLALKSLENAFKAAWRSGSDTNALNQRIQFFQNDFLTQARKYLPSAVKEILGTPKPQAPSTNKTAPAQQPPRTAPAATRPAQPPPAARTNGQARPAPAPPGKPAGWDAAFR